MVAAAIFKNKKIALKIEHLWYLIRNGLTYFDEIWHGVLALPCGPNSQ